MHSDGIYNRLINLLLLLFFNAVSIWSCSLPQLPEDENQGVDWVREGEINNLLWERVRPYYRQKISIADGELSEILILFDEFNCELPSQKSVKEYLPWSKISKKRFLKKYPVLFSILPILSFNSHEQPQKNRLIISTSIPKLYKQDPVDSKIKFTNNPINWLNIMGNIQFSEEKFRWYSRKFKYNSDRVLLSMGNFYSPLTSGLFYGYFPDIKIESNVVDNWKFGEKNGWNGALLSFNINRNRVSFMTHKRYGERAELLMHKFKIDNSFEVDNTLGLSLFKFDEIEDTSINFTTKIGVNSKSLRFNITAGISELGYKKIPLILYLGRSINKSDYSLSLTYLPKEFEAFESLTLKDAKSRLNLTDNKKSAIIIFTNTCRINKNSIVSLSSNISYLFTQNSDESLGELFNFRSELGLAVRKNSTTNLRYYYEKSSSCSGKHKVDLKFKLPLNRVMVIIPTHNFYIRDGEYFRFSSNLKIAILTAHMSLFPEVEFYANSKQYHSVKINVEQKISISSKTYGEYKLSLSPTDHKTERVSFYATLSFYF